MELSTPEPWLPVVRTRKLPSGALSTMPRWYSVRPGFLRRVCVLCALSSGGSARMQPIMRNRAGRTKAKKVTITATGLPGRPNKTASPVLYLLFLEELSMLSA
ncbi:hypothetical protein GALL_475640 [mine drainage metagenome]|uniref:Uncharacterized protein n=1 Tax=mine drainage metagenome TaxID=410659 RepID=A0A1J5PH93_9ZZZZ